MKKLTRRQKQTELMQAPTNKIKQKCQHRFILQTLLMENSALAQDLGIQFYRHSGPFACLPSLLSSPGIQSCQRPTAGKGEMERKNTSFLESVSPRQIVALKSCYYEILNNNSSNN